MAGNGRGGPEAGSRPDSAAASAIDGGSRLPPGSTSATIAAAAAAPRTRTGPSPRRLGAGRAPTLPRRDGGAGAAAPRTLSSARLWRSSKAVRSWEDATRRSTPARPARRRERSARAVTSARSRSRSSISPVRTPGRCGSIPSAASVGGRMAEYRPKGRGLERVLGTGALFSTAYGNVGSSIYYALGLVAIYALGMTPLVFLIAGVIFACTAATYAEATTMYPEAGGSSSFARHAFNEFWSFFAAWGQMLNYIITVAISAFFVPHYLGVFWEPLRHSPGDVFAGIGVVAVLALVNVVGVKEAAGLNIFLAIADFITQVLLVIIGAVLVLSPDTLVHNVDFGRYPTVTNFLIAIPIGMVAYTGIETVSNLAEEARDFGKTIPRAILYVVIAVAVIYAFLPSVALSAMPVEHGKTALAGEFAGDPILGIVRNLDLGSLQHAAEIYVGVLAATILFIATNAGLIGVSRLTYSMGQHRQVPEG